MPSRAVRRAAERLVAMQAAHQAAEPEPSAVRLAANQANAQLSTGPRTSAGKATSSLNAVKTALTGRTVLLPSDDAADYQCHILAYEKEWKPVGVQESNLVQSIADCVWRLSRICCLEQALFSRGHLQFAHLFADIDPANQSALIELHTFEIYEKQFRNLQLQEARLARRREKEIAELRRLQNERVQKHNDAVKEAAALYLAAEQQGKVWNSEDNRFEFSIDVFKAFLASHKEPKHAKTAAAA